MLEDFPLASVLMSMPGIGIKTAAQILLAIGDGTAFETAGHLAAYAGIAPVTRRSGTSIRGEFPARAGNKRLKNALFYSAWIASHCDPISKTYYDRKRAEGKRHNAAVICLARRRCNVIFAMLRNGTYYQRPTTNPHLSRPLSRLDSEHRDTPAAPFRRSGTHAWSSESSVIALAWACASVMMSAWWHADKSLLRSRLVRVSGRSPEL